MARYEGYSPAYGVLPSKPTEGGLKPQVVLYERPKEEIVPEPPKKSRAKQKAAQPEGRLHENNRDRAAHVVAALINFGHSGQELPLETKELLQKDPAERSRLVGKAQAALRNFDVNYFSMDDRIIAGERFTQLEDELSAPPEDTAV